MPTETKKERGHGEEGGSIHSGESNSQTSIVLILYLCLYLANSHLQVRSNLGVIQNEILFCNYTPG